MRYPHELVSVALTQYNLTEPYDELEKFRDAVLQGIHGLRATNARYSSLTINLYYDSCPYTVGSVWLDRDKQGNPIYTVKARGIDNNKFASYNPQRFTKTSKDLDKAVRVAKKYCRPYTPHELLHCTARDANSCISSFSKELHSKLQEKSINTLNQPRLLRELEHLVQANHSWVDPEFGEDLVAMLDLQKQADAAAAAARGKAWFVRVYQRAGQQMFDVIPISDIGRPILVSLENDHVGESTPYTDAGVPDWLMGKLAVLSMIGSGTYVEGVGYSVGEGMFYVTE